MILQEAILNYLLLYIILEIFEVSWQKAPSLMGMLLRMYKYYNKSIWLFLVMHPTFYFAIGFAMLSDYNGFALLLLFLKTLDVATKILLIQQVFIKKELSQELALVLLAPINSFLPYLGVLLYPLLILLALS
ncbi:MAG: hypothetical protein RBR54_07140 [Sulfurimonas sp.]|jgi:hypothetical protein|nr:hypothetical protein [Sulfurimonas sp.]